MADVAPGESPRAPDPYEIRQEAERIVGEDRVPTHVLSDLIRLYGNRRGLSRPTPTAPGPALEDQRRGHFERLRSSYGADGPDASTPGATSGPARYALLSENGDGAQTLNYADDPARFQAMVEDELSCGWRPRCYFDLDRLAGEAPAIEEGDRVRYRERELHVVHICSRIADETPYRALWLDEDPDKDIDQAQYSEIDAGEVEVIERAEPDEREPKRYELALLRTIVVFNTNASD